MPTPQPIRDEASRITEDSKWSARGHWEAAHLWGICHTVVGVASSVIAAAAGASALKSHTTTAAFLAMAGTIGTAVLTFLNPRERAGAHLKAGNAYKSLNNDARIFENIESETVADPVKALMALNERRNKLNTESPQISRVAYELARWGLKRGEADYLADRNNDTSTN